MGVSARALVERGLFHHSRLVRWGTVLAICLAAAVPVGAVLGLGGALYGGAALVGLAIGLLMLRSLMVGLLALVGLVCLLPFAAVPIDIGFSPTFLDLVLLALYTVWFGRLVTRKDEGFIAQPPTLAVLAFVFLALVSFVAGLSHAPLTANVLRHFGEILLSVVLFILVINAVRSEGQLRLLLIGLMVAGFLAALVGIILYILPDEMTVRLLSMLRVVRYPSGADVLRYIEDNPENPLRATSTSVDPNVLGGMLIFVTTITAAQVFARRPLLDRRLLIGMVLTMGGCLVLSFSRGSLAGLVGALGLMGLLRYRRILVIGLVVLALFLVLPFTRTYVTHFGEGVQGEDLATQMRLGEYKDALTLIQRYPWFGVGFSGTPEIDTYLGVSSVYLLIAEEMGLLGLGAFLAAFASFFLRFARALRRCPRGSSLEPALLGTSLGVAGALAAGVLDHYLFNMVFPHASALLWLTVGLGAVSARLILEGPSPAEEPLAAPSLPPTPAV